MRRLLTCAVALAVVCIAGCEREDWKPEVLARSGIGHDEAVLRLGRDSYKTYCAGCHGEEGDGEGPAARFLDPRPRDFRSGIIKFAAVEAGELPHDSDLERVIRQGLHGTAMSSWKLMSPEKVAALVQYVKTFAADAYAKDEPHATIVPTVDPWIGRDPEEAVAKGATIYHALARCSNCHPSYLTRQEVFDASKAMFGYGITSFRDDMYGGVVTKTEWGDELTAPDFLRANLKNGTEPDVLYRVIASGVGGTAMPTWRGALADDQLWALVHYVKHLTDMKGTAAADALRDELASQPAFVPPAPAPPEEES